MDVKHVKELIGKNNIHTIEVGFSDIHGVIRGKRISSRFFLDNIEKGFAFSKAALVWDIECGVFAGMKFANFENGYPDMKAVPILSTFRAVPWREGSAFVFCDLCDEHGEELNVSPRYVLKKVLKRAAGQGLKIYIGSELEFYLVDSHKGFLYDGIQCYSLYKGSQLEFVMEDIRRNLEKIGIYVEACNPEYGPGQVEVNIFYGEALDMADQTILFKNSVKEIARKHNLYATFMAKPWAGESGNGYHIHQSIWDLDGKENKFHTDKEITRHYLGGLLKHVADFMPFGSPTINAYKRIVPYSFAPYNVTWGYDNRTVAIRAILESGKSSRLEYRSGAADCNPYVAIAACIASGLNGLDEKIEPPHPMMGDSYACGECEVLPTTFWSALDRLEQNPVAPRYLGEDFVDIFLRIGRHESVLFNSAVTDWERKRYFEMV